MDEPVFISICVPAYSRVDFLKRLLDSIAAQTYRHFEVVITDDSPGNEVEVLATGHELGNRIRYFRNPAPLGTPENWNEGIRRAAGEWIKPMHDDDWFSDPASLERFILAAESSPSSFYFSAYENVFPDGKKQRVRTTDLFLKRLNKNPAVLLAANRVGPPSVVFFKNDPGLVFDRRFRWVVDFDFYIGYLRLHGPAVYIPDSLISIGISASQVTQSSFGNPAIEIPERFMLWEKLPATSGTNWMIYDSWWRFIRNLSIRDISEIRGRGYDGRVPLFVEEIIRWQKNIPRFLLKFGPFSKLTMTIPFLRQSFSSTN